MATLFDKQSDAILQAAQIQAQAISNAAAIQQQMAREALEFQKEQSQIARDTLAPFVAAGKQSTYRLMDILGIGGTEARKALANQNSSTGEGGFNLTAKDKYRVEAARITEGQAGKAEKISKMSDAQVLDYINKSPQYNSSWWEGSAPVFANARRFVAPGEKPAAKDDPEGQIKQIQKYIDNLGDNPVETVSNTINGITETRQVDISYRKQEALDTIANIKAAMERAGMNSQGVQEPLETAQQAQQRVTNELLNDPVFQGQIQTGIKTLDRSAAARGGLLSGRYAQELQQFGQQSASQYIQQNIQNLQNLNASGVGAAGGSANIAFNTGVQGSGILNGLGKDLAQFALASGQVAASAQLATSPAAEHAFNLARVQANPQGMLMAGGLGGQMGALGGTGRGGFV